MDPWVNSLVQSPLVRSLNTVPARISSFAHGVKDNVPPFSTSKVVVQPYQTSTTVPDFVHKFRIPQFGLLDRVYLRLRMNCKYETSGDTSQARRPWPVMLSGDLQVAATNPVATDHNARFSAASSSWNYADCLQYVALQTHNKLIEGIPAECIASEVQKMPEQARRFFEKSMCGFAAGSANIADVTAATASAAPAAAGYYQYSYLWDPSLTNGQRGLKIIDSTTKLNGITVAVPAQAADNRVGQKFMNHADFIIPLPFDCLKQLKDNFQTRFVEDLEIHVATKNYKRGIQGVGTASTLGGTAPTSGTDHYVPELVLLYHNFHDTIENAVRDQNYKRGFPASIYSHDWLEETVTNVSQSRFRVDFRSNNLVNEIIIVRQLCNKTQAVGTTTYVPSEFTSTYAIGHQASAGTMTAALTSTTGMNGMVHNAVNPNYRITFSGSGREIWSGTDHELAGPDTMDYELADGHPFGGDAANGGTQVESIIGAPQLPIFSGTASADANPDDGVIAGGCLLGFGRNLRVLKFGFQSNSNFYTGGVAFQTLSNPSMTLDLMDTGKSWADHTFRVYVKYSTMLRIDSDTGVITRTLDV